MCGFGRSVGGDLGTVSLATFPFPFPPRLLQAHAPRQPPPPFHIYIIEQSDDSRKFNRGKLLNIGFQLAAAAGPYDTYVFHDVDLLPSPELVPAYLEPPAGGPVHIARVWGRYSGNPKYIGGAVAFTGGDFRRINGFPNTFWGWGGEDDELRRRVDEVGFVGLVGLWVWVGGSVFRFGWPGPRAEHSTAGC